MIDSGAVDDKSCEQSFRWGERSWLIVFFVRNITLGFGDVVLGFEEQALMLRSKFTLGSILDGKKRLFFRFDIEARVWLPFEASVCSCERVSTFETFREMRKLESFQFFCLGDGNVALCFGGRYTLPVGWNDSSDAFRVGSGRNLSDVVFPFVFDCKINEE